MYNASSTVLSEDGLLSLFQRNKYPSSSGGQWNTIHATIRRLVQDSLNKRQTSKRVEKQDTWLVWEDNRKIHQQVCDKYLQAEAVLMNIYRTVRKADYYAHVFSSPETDRSNLYTEIDPKVFETTATIVSDGNAWTKLKLD
uniref:Uncharacterized protein n=1 Tax=Caenorhabditis japonica TaxID=281687 RepID=A0A8R1HKX7_CAEJA